MFNYAQKAQLPAVNKQSCKQPNHSSKNSFVLQVEDEQRRVSGGVQNGQIAATVLQSHGRSKDFDFEDLAWTCTRYNERIIATLAFVERHVAVLTKERDLLLRLPMRMRQNSPFLP